MVRGCGTPLTLAQKNRKLCRKVESSGASRRSSSLSRMRKQAPCFKQPITGKICCAQVRATVVEAYITEEDSAPRVARLHLVVVDLHRRRQIADRVLRLLVDLQIDRCAEECLNNLSIPWKQNQEAYQLRYVFGYAIEEVIFLVTFFGPYGQQSNPSAAGQMCLHGSAGN